MRAEAETATKQCGDDLLEIMAQASPEGSTVSVLARATGRDRGLVSRVIADFTVMGLAEPSSTNDTRHRLGWRLAALADRVVETRLANAGPFLDLLCADTAEAAYLVVRQGTESVTVAEAVPATQTLHVTSWVGRSFPVARSDAGPVLLSDQSAEQIRSLLGPSPLPPSSAARAPRTLSGFLELVDEVRRNGYSQLDEQSDIDTGAVAAPILDFRGSVVAAVVVTGPAFRVRNKWRQLVPATLQAADELSRLQGWRPTSAQTTKTLPRSPIRPPQPGSVVPHVARPVGSALANVGEHVATNIGRRLLVAILVMEAEIASGRGLSVAHAAERAGREKTQVSRGLKVLLEANYTARDDSLAYVTGSRMLQLAARAGHPDLVPTLRREMDILASETGERIDLLALAGSDCLTLATAAAPTAVQAAGWVGRTFPLRSSAAGLALISGHSQGAIEQLLSASDQWPTPAEQATQLTTRATLSEIERVRSSGFAVVDGDDDRDGESRLPAIAVPIRDHDGRVIAALSVSGPAFRFNPNSHVLAEQLLSAADASAASLRATSLRARHSADDGCVRRTFADPVS